MNPIFNRRYKGGGRPNIIPTTKRTNYVKSLSTTITSPFSSPVSSTGSDCFPNGIAADEVSPTHTGFTDCQAKRNDSDEPGSKMFFQSKSNGSSALAHQLLASKQNMLAQLSLTPHENHERTTFRNQTQGMRHSVSSEVLKPRSTAKNLPRSPTVHEIQTTAANNAETRNDVKFCELEDIDDDDMNEMTQRKSNFQSLKEPDTFVSNTSRVLRANLNLNQRISKQTLDIKTWRELKQVVCGSSGFHEGWIGQGFIFDRNIPFGLVQRTGGPCGALAVVQSLLVRNLLFGSPLSYSSNSTKFERLGLKEWLNTGDQSGNQLVREREVSLVEALAEILWSCGQSHSQCKRPPVCLVMFNEERFERQQQMYNICGLEDLFQFIEQHLHCFDCISLIYSAVLTRGISETKGDMDFENCSLVGLHGYCSQELINLLTLGKAISNTFDNEIELDGKILKGIDEKCGIGLLSLFEHYDSIKVGMNLKSPRWPVWIVCSESHFSVLFSCDKECCVSDKKCSNQSPFDLFYYDGLARQENTIRLSIRFSDVGWGRREQNESLEHKSTFKQHSSPYSYSGTRSSSLSNEDLIPPLEKCIRTKWHDAEIDWNGTEPLL